MCISPKAIYSAVLLIAISLGLTACTTQTNTATESSTEHSIEDSTIIDTILEPETKSYRTDNQTLVICKTNKQKARVYINHIYQGVTPLTVTNLLPGIYFIEVKKAGYEPYQATIQIERNYTQTYYISLIASTSVNQ